MNRETARRIAKAMERAGFTAAAENFVNERSEDYNAWQSKRLEKIWLS
jgi:hypothetical protein